MPVAKFVCPHCEKPAEVQVTSVTRSRECPHCGQAVILQVSGKSKQGKRKALLMGAEPPVPEPKPAPTPVAVKPPRTVEKTDETPKPSAKRGKQAKGDSALPIKPESKPEVIEPELKAELPAQSIETERPASSHPTAKLETLKGITGPAYDPQPLEGEVFERMKMDPQLQAHRRNLILGAAVVAGLIVMAIVLHFLHGNEPATAVTIPTKRDTKADSSSVSKLPNNAVALRLKEQPLDSNEPPKKLSFEVAKPAASSDGAVPEASVDPATVMRSRPVLRPANTASSVQAARPTLTMPGNINTAPALSNTRPLMLPRITGSAPEALSLTNATKAITAFLNAPSMTARLSMIANPDVLEPVMRDYYRSHLDGPIPFDKITSSRLSDLSSRMSEHTVLLKEGSIREVYVIHDTDGTCYVDWPSLVLYSEIDWADFMSKRSTQGRVFRVIAEKDEHVGGFFSDSKGMSCVKLTNPLSTSAPVIYAYTDKQSVVGRELDHWMKSDDSKAVKLTVRLKFPLDAENTNQVWLTDILGAGWVTSLPSANGKNLGQR